jgi:transposase
MTAPEPIVGRILRFAGYGVYQHEFSESTSRLRLWVRQVGPRPTFTCDGCGVEREDVVGAWERTVRDLPWGTWRVELVVEVHRVRCRTCGVKKERIPFLAGRLPYTKRFCRAVAAACEDAPVRRVAVKWGLSHQTVLRLDKRALELWSRGRRRKPVRYLGVDEVFWKKGRCLTVVSDLDTGEPIWVGRDRKRETLDRFFRERFWGTPRRLAVKAVCVDMWQPFIDSVRTNLPHAAIVYDKFHIMQHAGRAVDETRRQEFFRQGGEKRSLVKGKRWLLLKHWENLKPEEQGTLFDLLSLNRRLMKAYLLKEQLDRLWTYVSEAAARRFFNAWVLSIRWQRLPAFKKLVAMLRSHLDGILAYCHHKVPFGVVESINNNFRVVIRRGRGYGDERYLMLKVARSTYLVRRGDLDAVA